MAKMYCLLMSCFLGGGFKVTDKRGVTVLGLFNDDVSNAYVLYRRMSYHSEVLL